jgi:hypothetical protein
MILGGKVKKSKPEIKSNVRRSDMVDLKDFCVFGRSDDFVEVTEWSNGEGYDVSMLTVTGEKTFSLTHGEFDALKYLVKDLRSESGLY